MVINAPSLSSLQTTLSSGVSGLLEFRNMVRYLLPKAAGEPKDIMADIAKVIPIEPQLKMLSDGVSALHNNHRSRPMWDLNHTALHMSKAALSR
jgi:hypothetical protein